LFTQIFRSHDNTTVFAPFPALEAVMRAVPRIVSSGLAPHILEYIDALTMAAITHTAELSLGIPDDVREASQAYLVVGLENRDADRLDGDVAVLGDLLTDLGASDAYVLEGTSARKLIEARSEEHTSELQSRDNLVCRLLLEKV